MLFCSYSHNLGNVTSFAQIPQMLHTLDQVVVLEILQQAFLLGKAEKSVYLIVYLATLVCQRMRPLMLQLKKLL
jgi:hypothetical protein